MVNGDRNYDVQIAKIEERLSQKGQRIAILESQVAEIRRDFDKFESTVIEKLDLLLQSHYSRSGAVKALHFIYGVAAFLFGVGIDWAIHKLYH